MVGDVSVKCSLVLEKGVSKDICYDFRKVRSYVMCKAWDILDREKVPFRSAIRRAWEEAKKECAEAGAII